MNLIMDFLLVKPLGMPGLYIATIVCQGITYLVDIYVVYHLGFYKSIWTYLILVLKWSVFLAATLVISHYATGMAALDGIVGFAFRIVIITVVYGVLFLLVYGRSDELKYYLQLMKRIGRK